MSTNYIQKGDVLNYTADKNVLSGELVIIGSIAGVAKTDIALGSTGAVHITGIYSLPKGNEGIPQGSKVYWNKNVTITKGQSPAIGIAANSTISSDGFAQVLLNAG